jgi:hypothetical protein
MPSPPPGETPEEREERLAARRVKEAANREHTNALRRAARAKNPAIAERQRRYNAEHAEEIAASKKAWNTAHPENVKAWKDTDYARHSETYKVRARKRQQEKPEVTREEHRRWRENNREQERATKKAWREANPVVRRRIIRRSMLRTKYGLEPEEWDAMLIAQSGRCDICNEPMRNPQTDHCHNTGVVRGLLCINCNTGLGRFKDDPSLLRAALDYLLTAATGE